MKVWIVRGSKNDEPKPWYVAAYLDEEKAKKRAVLCNVRASELMLIHKDNRDYRPSDPNMQWKGVYYDADIELEIADAPPETKS